MAVKLYGYQYSVYSWIARLALEEKGTDLRLDRNQSLRARCPGKTIWRCIPSNACRHSFTTAFRSTRPARSHAISTRHFPGPRLQPTDPRHRARCSQIVSIVDSYAYWPLVRQVFSHRVFRPRLGHPSDIAEVQKGLEAAPVVLAALERLAADTEYLCGAEISLADIHLAPMIGYFAMAEEGDALLKTQRKLSHWWSTMSARPAYRATMPQLPEAWMAEERVGAVPTTNVIDDRDTLTLCPTLRRSTKSINHCSPASG